MPGNVRKPAAYLAAEALYRLLRQPGTGLVSDAAELDAAPDGCKAAFSGTLVEVIERSAPARICEVDLESGDVRVLTFGPGTDRLPQYSPDGSRIAFLSDRQRAGDFQLYILDRATGAAQPTAAVEGWVEYLHWSPDGCKVLLGVAARGADVAGVHGAAGTDGVAGESPSWLPKLETAETTQGWRRAWVYDLSTGRAEQIGSPRQNVWESAWCGNDCVVAVTSPGPSEGLWYAARLEQIDVRSGETQALYTPSDQLGWPAAAPSGAHVAVVEALCSDRWVVAGNVILINRTSRVARRLDVKDVDVTYVEWCSERLLMLAGLRGLDTVVGVYDLTSEVFRETWRGRELTVSGRSITVSCLNDSGDCVLLGEGFTRAPEVAIVQGGQYRAIRSFDVSGGAGSVAIGSAEPLSWRARDGLEIQGWLLRPRTQGPYGLVTVIHGGPVAHWRPLWLGRRHAHWLMLLERGHAVFLPNPRGSSGRGQDFARRVVGDMGGEDVHDILLGIDHLVASGVADRHLLGVTGVSYGGFMTASLIAHDSRFAAAVAVSPVTNWVTEHLLSNLSHWVAAFCGDHYTDPRGRYFERSPVFQAPRVRTPTLTVCGALDRCTPPEEAVQFHRALAAGSVDSALLIYPREGHGIRQFPELLDYAARVVEWFGKYLRSG